MASHSKFPSNTRPKLDYWHGTDHTRSAYLYILPAGIIMSFLTLFPLGFEVYMSFTDYSNKNLGANSPAPNWVGLDNYLNILNPNTFGAIFQNFDFFHILLFNLWWAFSNCGLHLILGVLVAVLLNVKGLWFKKLYRALYILPVAIPAIVVATAWRNIFDQNGSANALLRFLLGFLGNFDVDWLGTNGFDPTNNNFVDNIFTLAYWAMLTANVWANWPLYSAVATGALQSIPEELYEAAVVDGTNNRQSFFAVTLPLLRSAILPYAIFGFITAFNLFELSYFMSGGNPYGRTELLLPPIYRLIQFKQLYGLAAAFSVYIFLILLVLSLLANKLAQVTANADL
jgi:arabinogalactan oligomer/maltooligosaccharide transport system permease protein